MRSRSGPSPLPLWLLCLLWLPMAALAGTEADLLSGQPGYVDLDAFGFFERDQLNVHISVKGPLLTLVADATRENDPELSSALGALKGIEVRTYAIGESSRGDVDGLLEKMADKLRDDGWATAITVKVARDHGYAMLRFSEASEGQTPRPLGLVAMYLTEDNEAVFVNIVGSIDTQTIGRLARRYDLDLLAVDGAPP